MHRKRGNNRRRRVWTWGAVLVAFGLTALLSIGETAPAEPTGPTMDGVAARVNGVPITVLELKIGEISGLVRTEFGYHVIKVEEHTAVKPLSFEEVKGQVQEDWMRERTVARYQEYIGGLRGKATIEVSLP